MEEVIHLQEPKHFEIYDASNSLYMLTEKQEKPEMN